MHTNTNKLVIANKTQENTAAYYEIQICVMRIFFNNRNTQQFVGCVGKTTSVGKYTDS